MTANKHVILMLGARVRPDATPSAALVRRTRHAIALAQSDPGALILLSGGGTGPTPEADVAAEICRAAGIKEARLLRETASRTTVENLLFSAELLPERAEVTLVTDGYHMFRARMLCRILGIRVRCSPAPAPTLSFRTWGGMVARDVLAMPMSLISAFRHRRKARPGP